MIYELKGKLLDIVLGYLEENKEWDETVVKPFLEKYADPKTCKVALDHHPMFPSTVSGVFSESPLPKPWAESKYSKNYYKPSNRSKAGKELSEAIKALRPEPECNALYSELGFQESYFHISGNSYGSIPLSVYGETGKAFIKWKDNYPEISHPDLVEITHTEYKQITGKG
ncbi:MAG: DUF5420 family protein [Nodosilinea sp. WJT8-NPBG4]|jgi:hypothetical protein|nr:DUF5420 family protein [Nodosilinea sp. WJT8-NPBG4]